MELVEGRTLRELARRRARCRRRSCSTSPPRSPRGSPRRTGGHRAPRPQARERDGLQGRLRQDPRLRARQADRARRAATLAAMPTVARPRDAARHRHRHRRLHVAGAGERPAGRLPLRPVLPGLDPLRDGHGQASRSSGRPRAETLSAIIREEPEPLGAARPEAPAPLRWLVERCLAKDPEERYASTRDLARDLRQRARPHLGGLERRAGSPAGRRPDRCRAGSCQLLAAGLLLALAAVGAWLAVRSARSPVPAASFQRLTFRNGILNNARFSPTDRPSSTAPSGPASRSSSTRSGPGAPNRARSSWRPTSWPSPRPVRWRSCWRVTLGLEPWLEFPLPAARRGRSPRPSSMPAPTGRRMARSSPWCGRSKAAAGSSFRSAECSTRAPSWRRGSLRAASRSPSSTLRGGRPWP